MKAQEERQTLVWVDVSGFSLLPGLVRTSAPRGQTPLLRVPLTHDHLSVISALTVDGHLFTLSHDRAVHGPDIVHFLRHLLRHISGTLLVIWDGSPIHRAQPVTDVLASGAAARLHLERLPGDAPDLNPDEGSWP